MVFIKNNFIDHDKKNNPDKLIIKMIEPLQEDATIRLIV